jgi:murein DD-endopeptidase MepM/ murein hydrolase activator NlpD
MADRDDTFPFIVAGVALVTGGLAWALWPRDASAAGLRGATMMPGGRISSPFGPRGRIFHQGIDVSAPTGTPIYAPLAGRVIAAYPDGEVSGYGNVVTIRSGNIGLLFSHMSSMAVRTGQMVAAGQLVGRVGSTNSGGGFHTSGPHLHFEVIVPTSNIDHGLAHYSGSTPPRVDPQAWARVNGVRLV